MRKSLYIISIICTFVVASCGKKQQKADEAPLVCVSEAVRADGNGRYSFTGKTKSATEVNLAFRVSGQILRVLVNEGDYVRKGQVVAEMDSRDYEVQLNATKAEYEQVKADAERVMALYAEGNTTASNNDKARYGLQQITQKLQNHKNQLADTKLRSTIDGYVQTKLHESGETVSAGMPVLSVFGSDGTEVEIKISASDYANIDNMSSFYCKFDVTGSEEFPMSIARKSQEANASQLYAVRLRFVGDYDRKKITPGMTTIVYANAESGKESGVVNVPSTALLYVDNKAQVYVFDEKTSIVSLRPVNIVALHRNGTCDIDDGLRLGEAVVITGVHHISNGMKVRRMPEPTESNVGGML